MIQPDTLTSLISRLNQWNITETEFKDIQIKSEELIKQLFPLDNATTVYNIKTLNARSPNLFDSVTTLKSILEAKMQSILRKQQAIRVVEE